MRLLYIVPNINNEGGVARILSIKANYLIEKWGYEVAILTQNNGNSPLFYNFNEKITFHDMILKGNVFQFFNQYRKALKDNIEDIKPDIIIVCDNGLKAYLIPLVLKTERPIILEIHSSKFVKEKIQNDSIFTRIKFNIINTFKNIGAKKYDKFVVETPESIKEWKMNEGIIIPNPLWFTSEKSSNLISKKVIAVGRHTYEKGFDRMLGIWQKIVEKHPEWMLDIYGKSNENTDLRALAKKLNITNNVVFHEPVKNIDEKYLEASFYLMTSRFEGFGMVLIEAMASGLPCIAYDCPCGPRAVISHNQDGFLIENGNENDFEDAIETLILNENLRIEMGKSAKENSKKYDIDTIMQTWNQLFIDLKNENA